MVLLALTGINWVAVVVATVVAMVVGGVWYSLLFGKQWIKAMHSTPKAMAKLNASPVVYLQMALLYMAMATTLSVLLSAFGAISFAEGFWLGLLVGFGLLFMAHSRQILFGGNVPLIVINAGHDIVVVALMSGIIAFLR